MTPEELIVDACARLELHFCPRCLDGNLTITVEPPGHEEGLSTALRPRLEFLRGVSGT